MPGGLSSGCVRLCRRSCSAASDLAGHLHGGFGVVDAVGVDALAQAVAQDFAATAAHIEHAHARPHVGHGEGVAQAAREVGAFGFEKDVIAFAGGQEVFFRIEVDGNDLGCSLMYAGLFTHI